MNGPTVLYIFYKGSRMITYKYGISHSSDLSLIVAEVLFRLVCGDWLGSSVFKHELGRSD